MCEYCGTSTTSSASSSNTNAALPIDINWDRDQLENAIVSELANDVFTDIPGFLQDMFPVSEALLSTVWEQASRHGGLYDNSRERWVNYPVKPPKHEKHLYEPFVNLVKSIARCIPAEERNEVEWHDHHDRTPISLDRCASKVRPDIIATIGKGVSLQSNKPKQAGGNGTVRIPWSRILVPIEMKKRYYHGQGDGDCPALLQLLKYMRMVFHESIDRSFVLGIVLAHTKMSVYLADRTGVLGSNTFDIHEDPHNLIRVVVGVCTMSLAQLGWDTSMSLLREKARYSKAYLRGWKPKFSYQVPFNTKREDHYWVVNMPKPRSEAGYGVMEEDATERFVLFKALNLQRGQVIRGRATRIWKAWRFDDLSLPPDKRQVFIMKDSWRDDDRRLEGEFYKQIGPAPGVATMYSYGVVYVDGEPDIVASRIRRGLSVHAQPRVINEAQRKLRAQTIPTSTPEKSWGSTTDYAIFADILPVKNVEARTPRSKTHSRLVLETYGWPLKMALSPLEIVQAMQDVVMGHWTAFNNGVLHRDLSEGNVLITGSTEVGKRAVMIDFDYAKMLDDPTLADDPISGTRPFISGEILGQLRYFQQYGDEDDDGFGSDADNKEKTSAEVDPPTHWFYHDLESLFWVLFWLCVCRSGPATRRTDIFDNSDRANVKNLSVYNRLFSAGGNDQLANNKAQIIEVARQFENNAVAVSQWGRPLKLLLRQLNTILRTHYEKQEFPVTETYSAFMKALKDAEQLFIKRYDEVVDEQDPAYRAECARRAADRKDWTLPARKLSEPDDTPGANIDSAEPLDETGGSVLGSQRQEENPRLEAALQALRLVSPSSPNSSDSAGSGHTATEKPLQKSSQAPKQPQPSTHPAETNSRPSKRQPAKAPVAKSTSKVPQASAPPATQPKGVATRAMKRAALAVMGSLGVQTPSQGVSGTASEVGPDHSTGRVQDRGDEARDMDSTSGRKVVIAKGTRAPGRRTKGQDCEDNS